MKVKDLLSVLENYFSVEIEGIGILYNSDIENLNEIQNLEVVSFDLRTETIKSKNIEAAKKQYDEYCKAEGFTD